MKGQEMVRKRVLEVRRILVLAFAFIPREDCSKTDLSRLKSGSRTDVIYK